MATRGGKNKKLGRDVKKCAAYKASHHREQNKCKRVLKSSGFSAATDYARAHGISDWAFRNLRQPKSKKV